MDNDARWPNLNALLGLSVYGRAAATFLGAMREVVSFHYANCQPYRRLCDRRGFHPFTFRTIDEIPYLPTSIFKDDLLLSIPPGQVFREIQSSATSSGRSSRMGLDKETSRRQSRCFNRVVADRIGNERRPFIILDTPDSLRAGTVASARNSTIRSLLFCASEATACLEGDEDTGKLQVNAPLLEAELGAASASGKSVVIFGFTYILYRYAVLPLLEAGVRYNLAGSNVLHIGGWKRLEAEKVSPEKLTQDCVDLFGVSPADLVDFYGFTEQAGMIYPTCERGFRHTPTWGEVIARDLLTLKPLGFGQQGLLQFLTPIETSYPGHSVLTDDVGRVVGVDDCPCGRMGTVFTVEGRAPQAEVRGCGDIMAEKML